ncbi:MAG: ribosome maturation factor RimP [Candidatus Omnitrophota bacterium]
METLEKIQEIVSNLIQEKELELVDLIFRREGASKVLRLVLDKKGGISMDECAWASSRMGELLDAGDVIPEHYLLEVTSPGLDRTLKTTKDFAWAQRKDTPVKIITYGPVEEAREHIGAIRACDEEKVTIALKGSEVVRTIPLKMIAKAHLDFEIKKTDK